MFGALLGTLLSIGAVDVSWTAPAECPSEPEVMEWLHRRLAAHPPDRRAPVSVRIVVDAETHGYALRMETLNATEERVGTRTLRSTDCRDLADAAVLGAAIAIAPGLNLEPTATPLPPPALVPPVIPPALETSPPPVTPTRTEVLVPEPPPGRVPTRPRWRGVTSAELGLTAGRLAMPRPHPGAQLGLGAQRRHVRLLARAEGQGPSRNAVRGSRPGGIFGSVGAGFSACTLTVSAPARFVGCLGTSAGLALARGRNTRFTTHSANSVYWGVDADLGAELAVRPRLAMTVRASGGALLARPDFVLEGVGRACCTRWHGSLRAGLLATWGPR